MGVAVHRSRAVMVRTVQPYACGVIIRFVRHRGLRRLLEDDEPRFLRQDLVDRVRKILTVLILAENIDEVIAAAPPGMACTPTLR